MGLDINSWKPFKISEIFNTYTGGDLIINTIQEGEIPVISHTAVNNGIKIYSTKIEGQKMFNCEKTISLADRGTFFAAVQKYDFYIGTRVKALEFKDGKHSESILQFIATVINHEKFRFCYGRNCTNGLDDLVIKLPEKNEEVDYEIIEKYMNSLSGDVSDIPDYFLSEGYRKACWYLDNINQEDFEINYAGAFKTREINLSDKKWDYFIFDNIVSSVHNGKPYNSSELVVSDSEDYVSYVTRTDVNNGVSMYVQALDYQGIEKANAITIGDTTATIFFQEHNFITGPHIIVIRADWLNIYTASFIITILNQEKYRYPVFGRAFTKDLIKQTKLYLPIDDDGNPDYKFMEDYIKSLPFSNKI